MNSAQMKQLRLAKVDDAPQVKSGASMSCGGCCCSVIQGQILI